MLNIVFRVLQFQQFQRLSKSINKSLWSIFNCPIGSICQPKYDQHTNNLNLIHNNDGLNLRVKNDVSVIPCGGHMRLGGLDPLELLRGVIVARLQVQLIFFFAIQKNMSNSILLAS